MTRLLGIDLGGRRIGLAVGETVADWAVATIRPLGTLRRSTPQRDAAALARLVAEQRVNEIVVGLPLNMDGSEGEMADRARAWAAEVIAPLGLPIAWRDERLTSVLAATRLAPPRRGRGGGPPSSARRQTHRAAIDREAAASIVQAEIDARLASR